MSHSKKIIQEFGTVNIDTLTTSTVAVGKANVTQLTSVTTGVTANAVSGIITTFTQTAGPGVSVTFAVTNNKVSSTSVILTSVSNYTGTTGTPIVQVDGGSGSGTFNVVVTNVHAADNLDGVVAISFLVV